MLHCPMTMLLWSIFAVALAVFGLFSHIRWPILNLFCCNPFEPITALVAPSLRGASPRTALSSPRPPRHVCIWQIWNSYKIMKFRVAAMHERKRVCDVSSAAAYRLINRHTSCAKMLHIALISIKNASSSSKIPPRYFHLPPKPSKSLH